MKKNYFFTLFGIFSILLNGQNTAPEFTSVPIMGINVNESYSYVIEASDVDNDGMNFSVQTLPSWLSFVTNINVSTFVGSIGGDIDGQGTSAQLLNPKGIDVDDLGNIYVADYGNDKIKKITPSGVITTIAGSSNGFADGIGGAAKFDHPSDIAVDTSGNIFVADRHNHRIRKVTPSGEVSTVAGYGTSGYVDGQGTGAVFNSPEGIALDNSGNIIVADTGNHKIRKIDSNGNVTTIAGGGPGDDDDVGQYANFWFPRDVEVDKNGDIFVADATNSKVRKVTPSGVVTTYAGSGVNGDLDGNLATARFHFPESLTIDDFGNIFVVDNYNHKIKKVSTSGEVTTIAGSSAGFAEGIGLSSKFRYPQGISIDKLGNLYVGDANNHRIRKITTTYELSGNTSGQLGVHDVVLQINDPNGGSTNQEFSIEVVDGTPPVINVLSPIDNATNVEVDSNFEMTFNKNILKGNGNILIKDISDNSIAQTIDIATGLVTINGHTATVKPDFDLSNDKNYYIEIESTAITDVANNPFAGISDSTSWNFSTTASLSVTDKELREGIFIYPNPVKKQLVVKTEIPFKNISIINFLGQEVLKIEEVNNYIDLSSLDSGVYFLRFASENGIITKKIIKR